MSEHIKIDRAALENYLSQYKANFDEHRLGRDSEIYKWRAVKCFQDNWDIDAPDFAAMIKASLAKTANLLASSNFFAKGMLEEFAKAEPEALRDMFRMLFDEEVDVAKRVKNFEECASVLCEDKPGWKNSYQNPNAISTYLWLRYPDKYYVYKYSVVKNVAEKLSHQDLPSIKLERMTFGFALFDALCAELAKDQALVAMSRKSLGSDCYVDEALRTLAIDVGYFISKHEQENTAMPEKEQHEELYPNIILFGPPGTGKTYRSVQYAVAIIEDKPLEAIQAEEYATVYARYNAYKDEGLIDFTTFHQSFGYEEFIEGIRPVMASGESSDGVHDIAYEIRDGVFKVFCDKAGSPVSTGADTNLGFGKNPTVWKVSLEGTGDNPTRKECMENNHIRIGWDQYGPIISEDIDYRQYGGKNVLGAFNNAMQLGDIVLSCYSSRAIDAIGVVTGEPEWREEYDKYKRLRNVRWLVKGINEDVFDLNGQKVMTLSSVYRLSVTVTDVMALLKKNNPKLFEKTVVIPNRVFIIDEINRGNISKIFGELITLIEPPKRIGAAEEQRAMLPYSGKRFGVPSNIFIIGTMNTADRSIALIDTALRRRFSFVEMLPDSSVLEDVVVEGIDMAEVLDTLNHRISALLDREHMIGHSYLLPLKKKPELDHLAVLFENKIIPLLQEYFYDDYEKIQLVLGDNQKEDESICFVVKRTDGFKLFGDADVDCPEYYQINHAAFRRVEAYGHLY